MITSYTDKKLSEYLEDGMNVLILFGHGLGDTMMFIPVYEYLKRLYPNVKFHLYVENGQEEIFGSAPWHGYEEEYDHIFSLNYPMCEWTDKTKNEMCCETELGIPYDPEVDQFASLERQDSPLVAVHFQGTALPGSVNCPEEVATKIWQEVLQAGLIPIEVHFKHIFHNPVNEKYGCVNRSVRDVEANLPNLIGLLQRCRAFIGVASGPFTVAMSVLGAGRVLYLEKGHKIQSYVDVEGTSVPSFVNVDSYVDGVVLDWLGEI